jgi:DNA-binding response OmpR family regulator
MSQSILIIDDSIPQHTLVTAVLAGQSFEFFSAFGGQDGVKMACSVAPDLILLDVDMPDMNGFEVCRLLKFNAATAQIPVIFITTSSTIDEKVHGFDLQAVDYITKPFDPADLSVRVRGALRTRHLLGLLPKSAVAAPGIEDCGDKLFRNPRLSMAQLTEARAGNPWNRMPPASSDLSGDEVHSTNPSTLHM